MRIKTIITCLLSIWLLFISSYALAVTPPFAGGPISSPYGPRKTEVGSSFHKGLDIGVDNTYIVAPTDGYVLHLTNHGYGEAHLVFYFGENTPYHGQALLIGDLGDESNHMNGGHIGQITAVKEGETIGVVRGYVEDVADGPHAHIEYIPKLEIGADYYHLGDPSVGHFLKEELKMDLTGDFIRKGWSGGDDDEAPGIPWNIQALMGLGNSINDTMKEFQGFAKAAYKNIHTYAMSLLFLLFAIDITFLIILSGLQLNLETILSKLTKFGIFIFIVNNWNEIVNQVFKGFITMVTFAYADQSEQFANDVTQPQLLLQKAISLIEPALNKIASFGTLDFVRNIGSIIPIYLMAFAVIAFFVAAALYIMICYLEFYISGALCIITVPFSILHWSKFIPEGTVGHLLSSTLKLMLMAVLVGLATITFKDATVNDIFAATVNTKVEESGQPTDTTSGGYVAMIYEEAANFGVDGNVILAIAMRESGGDTIDGIRMVDNPTSSAKGIMQVTDGQEGLDENGIRVEIEKAFPNYRTDPRENIRAGIAIFKYKLEIYAEGNIPEAVGHYFGAQDAKYINSVLSNLEKVNGQDYASLYSSGNKNPHKITVEQTTQFMVLGLMLIAIAVLVLKVPDKLMSHLGGPIELP